LRNQSGDVDQFVARVLELPARSDLSSLWNARDDRGLTPFWAAIAEKALTSAAAFLNLAAGREGRRDVRRVRFVQCIEAGFSTADVARLHNMLSARDNDGMGLLHILARQDLHQAMTFVADQLLKRNFNEPTMEGLWTQALRSDPGGPSLLVEALKHGKVLDGMLARLTGAKQLSEDSKQRLLADLLTIGNCTIDRRPAALPILKAVSASTCSAGWKTAQHVLVDLLTRSPGGPTRPTQLHVAAVMSADAARPRMEACVQLLRKDIISPESLGTYLGARNGAGRTAFEEAAWHRKADVIAAFLGVAAGDDPQTGRAVFRRFVADSMAAADEAMLSALLDPDGTGRTVFHTAASARDGEGLCLLITCLQASRLDAGIVVPLLAAALARTQNGKTLLWEFAADPSAADVLGPMVAALARSRWSAAQKEALWRTLVETAQRPPRKATAAMLELLSASAGDLLPLSIRRSLEASPTRSPAIHRQVIVVEQPLVVPTHAQYLFQRQVDIDHVLDGGVNAAGQAVGGHALMPASSKRLRARPDAIVSEHANGTFTVFVDIKPVGGADWIPKNEPSTCFPLAWTRRKMRHEIASALRSGNAFTTGAGPWDSHSDSGLRIRFYRDLDSGTVTCFPLSN
jgi:hypothetical protein